MEGLSSCSPFLPLVILILDKYRASSRGTGKAISDLPSFELPVLWCLSCDVEQVTLLPASGHLQSHQGGSAGAVTVLLAVVVGISKDGLPRWLGNESACNAGDVGSIPGSGRSPGTGSGNPLQYSCLENSVGRGAWWVTVHGVVKSQTQMSN